jgi:hypothetical protein
VYTAAITSSSAFMTKTSMIYLSLACILAAFAIALVITMVPETWSTDKEQSASSTLHGHQFLCPFVPGLPLAGIACNAFMMGSLPVSSWFFCLAWLFIGVSFYFSYGIHHSKLQHNDRYTESTPLVAMADVPART